MQTDVDANEADADASFLAATGDRGAIRGEFASADTALSAALTAAYKSDDTGHAAFNLAARNAIQADVDANEAAANAAIAAVTAVDVIEKSNGNSLEINKVNWVGDIASNCALSLPASAAGLIGRSIWLKASGFSNGSAIVVDAPFGTTIDGGNFIKLESPYAAVRLTYIAAGDWRVF